MTLGWFWCFGWYHNVQLALVPQAYLTHLTQESSSLPSDHTCFFAVCNSSCPHPGAARQDQELWILLIFMSDLEKSTEALFFKSGIQGIPRRWGGLLWVPDPGSSKLPGHFMLNNSLLAHKPTLTCLLSGLFLPCLSDKNNPRDKQGFFYHYHQ